MDTIIMIDAPFWLRLAVYLWLIGKAVGYLGLYRPRRYGFVKDD